MSIRIDDPCEEDWNRMRPQEQGRLCESCNKRVVDFTSRTRAEIESFLSANEGVCGRFRASQVNQSPEVIIRVPVQSIYRMTRYQRMILAFLFAFSSLFSCTNDQNVPGKIKRVEIVSNNSSFSEETDPGPLLPGIDSVRSFSPPEPGINELPLNKTESVYPEDILPEIPVQEDMVLGMMAMPMPEYPGGEEAMYKFIRDHIASPKDTFSGKVIVEFTVSKEGKICDPRILRSLAPAYDWQVLNILHLMPDWIPGTSYDKAVDTKFVLPVSFEKQAQLIRESITTGVPLRAPDKK